MKWLTLNPLVIFLESLSEPFVLWVNDGLMAVFFLYVILELKREILGGKLSNPRNAILPIGAAMGGMLVSAFIIHDLQFRKRGPKWVENSDGYRYCFSEGRTAVIC